MPSPRPSAKPPAKLTYLATSGVSVVDDAAAGVDKKLEDDEEVETVVLDVDTMGVEWREVEVLVVDDNNELVDDDEETVVCNVELHTVVVDRKDREGLDDNELMVVDGSELEDDVVVVDMLGGGVCR